MNQIQEMTKELEPHLQGIKLVVFDIYYFVFLQLILNLN